MQAIRTFTADLARNWAFEHYWKLVRCVTLFHLVLVLCSGTLRADEVVSEPLKCRVGVYLDKWEEPKIVGYLFADPSGDHISVVLTNLRDSPLRFDGVTVSIFSGPRETTNYGDLDKQRAKNTEKDLELVMKVDVETKPTILFGACIIRLDAKSEFGKTLLPRLASEANAIHHLRPEDTETTVRVIMRHAWGK